MAAMKNSNGPGRFARGGKKQSHPQKAPVLNHEQARIRKWVKETRFKRALFGVRESDVWKKIGELTDLYEAAISAERARYDALLTERTGLIPDLEQEGDYETFL